MFDCTCNTQNSLLLNQHNGEDAPQDSSCVSDKDQQDAVSQFVWHNTATRRRVIYEDVAPVFFTTLSVR